MTVQVWSSTVDAVAVSREADAWLSAVLGHDVRLVYMPDDGVRDADARFSPDTRV
ncbi:MAG: MOSC domain-containing protein, partial [Thermoplasmata archaeon]|nr:MOSC domain-containing protein [Thermoplasmata archaeon]NIW87498.1 MOSC domain-containing protein [Thermoplasmata archaeon]